MNTIEDKITLSRLKERSVFEALAWYFPDKSVQDLQDASRNCVVAVGNVNHRFEKAGIKSHITDDKANGYSYWRDLYMDAVLNPVDKI